MAGDTPEDVLEEIFDDHNYTLDALKEQAAIARAVARHFDWVFEHTAEEVYPRESVEGFDLLDERDFESNYQDLREAFGAEREGTEDEEQHAESQDDTDANA